MVLRSLRQHLLSTTVTALSIALAGGLLMAVWVLKEESRAAFTQMTGGFDAVLGARSSPLQLVLNSVFHLEASPGNIELEDYENIAADPNVALAVPIAVGDSYRGYRVVGTTPQLFSEVEYAPGRRHEVEPGGRWFDPELREAVVGSFVARRLNLKPGDTFHPAHGISGHEEHEDEYVVVGVLKPSNTPVDRVIWIPLEGLQLMSGHHEESHNEISAVLLKFRNPIAGRVLQQKFNQLDTRLMLAWPIGMVVAQLFEKIGWFDRVLAMVAYLVAIVATGSVLASIYNSMNERRREIAILRALGAHRGTVFGAVVLECAVISAVGMIFGFIVYAIITATAGAIVRAETGVVLEPFRFHPVMWMAPAAMVGLGAVVGIVPAWKAYRTDVASNLAPAT